jgi:pyrimidine-nucleoside phosphorylase
MRAVDIIRKKRDGEKLSETEIESFVRSAAAHAQGKPADWAEYQLSALLMAIYLKKMDDHETALLTRLMTNSGKRYRWDAINGKKVDKHSTGGVGDKTSLILAPLVAACGGVVPMMSGRGLGHTGGTLDKLESIPGFRVGLSESELQRALERIGVGMIGQTPEVAPADKTLYSLRDVTSTVESIPLITASILSKKLAEGIDGLVMDVKCGSGAFMKTYPDAKALAESIVSVGNANGVKTVALITAMDFPLGRAVGNSLEVIECIEVLKNRSPGDLENLSVILSAEMLLLAGLAETLEVAEQKIRQALVSGAGLEKFREIIREQNGDPKVIDDYTRFPLAPHTKLVRATHAGYLHSLHAEKVGIATMLLGAGRAVKEANVFHDVGARILKTHGQSVVANEPLIELHYRDEQSLALAESMLETAIEIGNTPPEKMTLIRERIGDR